MPDCVSARRSPSIAAIVVNWRGLADTIECVESLERSTLVPNIVIVDNGSDDGSYQALRRRFAKHDVLESPRNLGFGGGCNIGIRAALHREADYVLLVNNDARVFDDTIERLVAAGEAQPGAGLIGGVLFGDSTDAVQTWGGGWVSLWSGRGRTFREPVDVERLDYIAGACLLIRSRVLRDVGLFDESSYFMYCEDTDLAFRAKAAGWQLSVASAARARHRGRGSFRGDECLAARYAARSLMIFLLKYSRMPAVPIVLSTVFHVGRSLIRRRFDVLSALMRGRMDAWRDHSTVGTTAAVVSERRSSSPFSYSS